MAGLYSLSSLVHYEDAVDRMNSVCVRKFSQFAQEKRKMLVPEFMQCYAFDVIGEITVSLMVESQSVTLGQPLTAKNG